MQIFDLTLYNRHLERAQATLHEKHDFLLKHAADAILEHLRDINRDFKTVIELGYRTPHIYNALSQNSDTHYIRATTLESLYKDKQADVLYEAERLPLEHYTNSCDLVICNLHAHHLNDVPGFLIQAKQLLKNDGLFIMSLFGVESLQELRQTLQFVQANIYGEMRPRLSPLVDIRDAGALLQRAGFALPVIDKERLTLAYKDLSHLMHELRGMGETNIMNGLCKHMTPKQFFTHAQTHYKEHFSGADGLIDATVEILYLTGWKPDSSQQQPLKPGSAEKSLIEALTKE